MFGLTLMLTVLPFQIISFLSGRLSHVLMLKLKITPKSDFSSRCDHLGIYFKRKC